MKKKRKRFNSKKRAESFAKKVKGQLNDLRDVEGAKSPFTVTYKQTKETINHGQGLHFEDQFPEDYWR